ncbi:DUF3732 domain-containing protein [Vreelandella zhaodongensis]|uniref:DUF3732 domain-containing protein n=1 Tax=Vreelandella zhaodongensis TaxID=1176240 RepID=A0ABX2SMC4_VREZH|nr:DUF3732 domain-containing protein [Halomonas zhaodongensis]NYS43440.1 DUF3732 domain-containing protein [Halomonas zhaodongensis]
MNINLIMLVVRSRKNIVQVDFSKTVTFIYGPVGTGKSSVARLIDYCFGGELERTPAIQHELVSVTLEAKLGKYDCTFERGSDNPQFVRVTWSNREGYINSVKAPIAAGDITITSGEVYNLSDLIFSLCDIEPIKVLKRSRDPDSPMIRLSFRDIWRYCYLDQAHLDSSFFRLEEPFRARKSQDAMRFFTGLHSERLSQLQLEYYRLNTKQHGSREAIEQIRSFMVRFEFGSEEVIHQKINDLKSRLARARNQRNLIEKERANIIHPSEGLRERLRLISNKLSDLKDAINMSTTTIQEQIALRSELITTKLKAEKTKKAASILEGVKYSSCPQCGTDIKNKEASIHECSLCCANLENSVEISSNYMESVRREVNDRIDQINDSINRRNQELERSKRELVIVEEEKRKLDFELQDKLKRYDSAYIEAVRDLDKEIAKLDERLDSYNNFKKMSIAIEDLKKQEIDSINKIEDLKITIESERKRLSNGEKNARKIAEKFREIMIDVGFPGFSENDKISLDPRNWKPVITHSDQEWGFWDTGSGGKKTLFNVCYALAIHEVALEDEMPVPNILIIDSPTKNISEDENPELIRSLYNEIYRFASSKRSHGMQLLLIDSDLVEPEFELTDFLQRRMAGEAEAPSLIPYYVGP